MKVIILFGGNSSEHEVSCHSAKSILEHIDSTKFEVVPVLVTRENEWYFLEEGFTCLEPETWFQHTDQKIENILAFLKQADVVFPMIHGTNGEDGKLQGMLDLFQIPYVGCGTLSSALAMDKVATKRMIASSTIPQLPFQLVKDQAIDVIFPVIVKPANGGSSLGISKANNQEELQTSIALAKQYDSKVLLEPFIKARELEVAVLEREELLVSDVGEIISANEFYDYEAKYENAQSKTILSASLPEWVKKQIQDYAKQVFELLDCRGYARIDFFYVEEKDQIYFNELNTIPGFTKISMYPKLMEEASISYQQLITDLIASVNRK